MWTNSLSRTVTGVAVYRELHRTGEDERKLPILVRMRLSAAATRFKRRSTHSPH
jgi:hypothetical protein